MCVTQTTFFELGWSPDSYESKQKCRTTSTSCPLAYRGSFPVTTEQYLRNQHFMLLKTVRFGQPQNAPGGTREGCCALEKSSPALPGCSAVLYPLPHQAVPHSTAQMFARYGTGGNVFPSSGLLLATARGTARGRRALESRMMLDEPCNKIIIKIIPGYESHKSLSISGSKFGLFWSFEASFRLSLRAASAL